MDQMFCHNKLCEHRIAHLLHTICACFHATVAEDWVVWQRLFVIKFITLSAFMKKVAISVLWQFVEKAKNKKIQLLRGSKIILIDRRYISESRGNQLCTSVISRNYSTRWMWLPNHFFKNNKNFYFRAS